jgi:plasmid maintenance system killer protein
LEIEFISAQFEAECTQEKLLLKKFNKAGKKKMQQRLSDLLAAASLEEMRNLPGHCEELVGDRKGQFSVRLDGVKRLIFKPDLEPVPTKDDGGIDWTKVTAITILEVVDYHG